MKLALLPEAAADIDRLFEFLVARDPIAAQKAMLAIDEGLALLAESPYLGIERKEAAPYRELFVPFG
jgi:plasmid stabilization system protein ParE